MNRSSISHLVSFIATDPEPITSLEVGEKYFYLDWYGINPCGVLVELTILTDSWVELSATGVYENQQTHVKKSVGLRDYGIGWKLSKSNIGISAQTLDLYTALKLLFPPGIILFLEEDLNRVLDADCLESYTHNPVFKEFFKVEWGKTVNDTTMSVSSYYPVYTLLRDSMYQPKVKPTLRALKGGGLTSQL